MHYYIKVREPGAVAYAFNPCFWQKQVCFWSTSEFQDSQGETETCLKTPPPHTLLPQKEAECECIVSLSNPKIKHGYVGLHLR